MQPLYFCSASGRWEGLSTILRNPNSSLEKLDLDGNSVNDRTMVSLANSLANNNKLKELLLINNSHTWVTADGWGALLHVLCNASSIMATYHSNQTLEKLCNEIREDELPQDIRSLLVLIERTARTKQHVSKSSRLTSLVATLLCNPLLAWN